MLDVEAFMTYSGATDTDKATPALNKAEGFAVSQLGKMEEATYTDEQYDGNGEMTLILKHINVTAVTELKFSDEVIDDETYFPNNYGIRMYYPFPKGFGVIKVTYTAGWTAETLPEDLKTAIYDLAYAYYQSWDSLGTNIKRESIDGASIEWGDLPDTVEPMSIINSYRPYNV